MKNTSKIGYVKGTFTDKSFSLINALRNTFDKIEFFEIDDIGDTDYPTLISEEKLYNLKKKNKKIIVLVLECFIINQFTKRIGRNLINKNFLDLLVHIFVYYINLFRNFEFIKLYSKYDLILLPFMPIIFILYVINNLFYKNDSALVSKIKHEYHFSRTQYHFDKFIKNMDYSGSITLLFSHEKIKEAFDFIYINSKFEKLILYPKYQDNYKFKISGKDLRLISWYGSNNYWRRKKIKVISSSLKEIYPNIKIVRSETTNRSEEVFHMVLKQSDLWAISSPIKIFDIINCGKVPICDYNYNDTPICDISISIEEYIKLDVQVLQHFEIIIKLEKIINKKIASYSNQVSALIKKNQTKLLEIIHHV